MITKTYSELITILTFEERFKYLQIGGAVGVETFGFDRYLNQVFYMSPEWKQCRNKIIVRDDGHDLGCEGYEIHGRILVHHINPITMDDIVNRSFKLFDPNNLICTTHNTHLAIHYGDESLLPKLPIPRKKNDTCPWRN